MSKDKLGIILAILAAICYSLLNPINKLVNNEISPLLSASMLYFGTLVVGLIILLVQLIAKKITKDNLLNKKDFINLLVASLFHISSCVLLMFGLTYLSSSNASLLASFEIISTSLIAFFLFKERINNFLWIGIVFIFLACVTISLGDFENLNFSIGTLLCLLSPLSMGFANNFLKKVSYKNPAISVSFLGLLGGSVTLIIALIIGERFTSISASMIELSLGMVSYGIALILFIFAEKYIGAAKTSAFFSLAPFIAIILSLIIFKETPNYTFYIGLGLLFIGVIFASLDAFYKKRSIDSKR